MWDRVLGTRPAFGTGQFATTCRTILLAALASTFATAVADYPDYHDTRLDDFANVVQPADAEQIRTALTELRDNTGIEAVVVTIDSVRDYGTGDATIESFATNLFNAWGIGNRGRNDGAMLLVAVKDRKVRIEVGSGFGTRLNAPTKRIIDNKLVPAFKRGDYSVGILEGALALREELNKWKPAAEAEEPAFATSDATPTPKTPEAESSEPNASPHRPAPAQAPARPVAAPVRAYQVPESLPKQAYAISNTSSNDVSALAAIAALLTGGVGAAVAGLMFTRSNKCPRCKVEMVLCNPARDYERLDAGQELEERLNSVDYQFYRCPLCGHENMRKTTPWFSGYSQCPQCSYRTMRQSQEVLSQPTRHSTGSKLVSQVCKHCSYHHEETLVLPMLPDNDHFHGSGISGGGSLGGHSGGGGFGGGHSSGGGSSGSW